MTDLPLAPKHTATAAALITEAGELSAGPTISTDGREIAVIGDRT